MFLIIKGNVIIKLKDRDVNLKEGEMFIVPKYIQHKPIVPDGKEAYIMLIEPKGVVNTGNNTESNLNTGENISKLSIYGYLSQELPHFCVSPNRPFSFCWIRVEIQSSTANCKDLIAEIYLQLLS